jgi:hypothetical protein
MPVYRTPGIYRQSQPAELGDIRAVRTDVAGFVGFAERGPLPSPAAQQVDPKQLAIRLTSWKGFLGTFGGFRPYGFLAYAIRAFFENGGTTCYVVRVAATNHTDPLQRPRTATFALPTDKPIKVASLGADQFAGQDELILDDATGLQEGDLVAVVGDLSPIVGPGVIEFAMVVYRPENDKTSLRLGRKLGANHAKGDEVWKYPSSLIVTATSPGNWGNRIKLVVTPLTPGPTVTEFSLRVTVDPGFDPTQPREEEFYKKLSLDRNSNNYAPDLVNSTSQLIRLEILQSPAVLLIGDGKDKVADGPLGLGPVQLEGGRDGLSGVQVQDVCGGLDDLRGLRLLEEIDEVAILCIPDAVFEAPAALPKPPLPPADPCVQKPTPPPPDPVAQDPTAVPPPLDAGSIQQSMLDQGERLGDRVAILDPPDRLSVTGVVDNWRTRFTSRFGSLYYPWLKVPDPLRLEGLSRRVPPSGHVAGIYAQIDNQFGVQRPPANAALEFVTDVVDEITALQQENLNPFDVNAIRPFPGRGIRIWGARSLAGADDADWRFIHVRRLMSMIEESVEDSMQWAVFEPNDDALRRTLVHSLTVFLEAIWRTGGLQGATPAEGFYVKCDETNNPPAVVDAGQIICEVGIAVAAPMEFLVFEIRNKPGGSDIREF